MLIFRKKNKMTTLSNKVFQDPIYFMAFGFGSGLSPIAPGTMGTIAAIPIYWLLSMYAWPVYAVVTVIGFIIGVYVCESVTRDLGEHDYKGIVWDEIIGYLLTMFMVPRSVFSLILGFLLFRLFDIWKPQPIRWVDHRVQGGLGIMLDDVVAAIPAWGILQLLYFARHLYHF
jgi:phosphatidylglycerophosphatase A